VVSHDREFRSGERKFNMGEKSLNGYELKKLWRNDGGYRFTDVSVASGAGDVHDARGMAGADFDGDGDIDFFIRNYKQRSVFLRNEGVPGNWLNIRLRGTKSNRDAIGARVTVVSAGRTMIRETTAGTGYLSQLPNEVFFGLGTADSVESVTVRWPCGDVQKFGGASPNRRLLLVEGELAARELETRRQAVFPALDADGTDALAAGVLAADVRDLDGKPVDLRSLGPVSFLSFWATWCNVCRAEFPDLNALSRAHEAAGVRFAAVTVLDEAGPDLRETLAELKPAFPVYTISRRDYDRLFGADAAVPRALLVEGGRVSEVFTGKIRPYLVKSYFISALRRSK
jgi:thiol-disulfide isomerase/thioredoxin